MAGFLGHSIAPCARDAPEWNGFVRVRGAREHNLKSVDLDVPRNALVVFTGVSGSGKSSLAFGTLYAEAQRRYFESVAPYARRLIEQVGAPDVDAIEGLPPAVALQQQRGAPNARSSVGSVTTLSSVVRMMYSRVGSYPPKQPMLYAEDFSPNTVQGACTTCHGLGRVYDATERSMVPDDSLTIRERAIAAWPPAWHGQNLRDILVTLGYDVDTPWRDLPRQDRDWILFTDEQPTVPVYAGFTPKETRAALKRKTEPSYQGTFSGARRYVLHTFASTQSALMKKRVSKYMISSVCPTCNGKRLKPEVLSVTFAGLDIGELSLLPLARLASLLEPVSRGDWPFEQAKKVGAALDREARRAAMKPRVAAGGARHGSAPDMRRTPNLSEEKRVAAQRLAIELLDRIKTLIDLGLGYLSLDRATPTLSSGELQRLRLATQLSSQLFGVVYVLDEPSAGLHPADGDALLEALQRLKAAGNSLFVVEHDLGVMRQADWLVDVGPNAGEAGGEVVYSGPPDGLSQVTSSHTRRYLFSDDDARQTGTALQRREPRCWLRLQGVTRNNLHQLDAAFPLGCLSVVTGISGSGKSSLVSQALPDLVAGYLGRDADAPDEEGEADPLLATGNATTEGRIVDGMERIRRLVRVDQRPIGRTPRSNLATYSGLFDHVRKLFAQTPAARKCRYSAGRFSFNVAQGRCPTCEGEGFVMVELLFLPSVYAACSTCHGSRYNPQTLKIRWRERTIADVLAMTVDRACEFFAGEAQIMRSLDVLRAIGLGYLRLGQPATELSGGEAQRIKLATELQRAQRGDTLYILDEPTTGLHPADTDRLMKQLNGLVDAGNTVILVEHDMRVAAGCDWLIDVGPGAGEDGGRIVAAGVPEMVARQQRSRTARYLREALALKDAP
ncbi:excinuclease ABC subunit UvrA [Paraburkholderia tropica]|uniref:excinuclease ABC subunit UvrA n=1 Tax=Paraburkholderia tropica TaxID=92647 RepID=UPI001600E916|nr:excinuclease ABC subunit UvrA [Paraburkholderia tropica]QNB17616.1 excinuclease ABC subunit UvrA [Paraburkholderia tropica]